MNITRNSKVFEFQCLFEINKTVVSLVGDFVRKIVDKELATFTIYKIQ